MPNDVIIDSRTGEILSGNHDDALLRRVDGVELSPVGMTINQDLSFDEWVQIGKDLNKIEGAIQWWRGDWLNSGERQWGEKYAQGIQDEWEVGYQSLANYAWVSKSIDFSIRMENLSWTHHQIVAPLEPALQKKWLDRAVDGEDGKPWTVAQLKREIKTAQYIEAIAEQDNGATDAQITTLEGDTLKIAPTLQPGSFDLLLTDPPYNTKRMDWDTWQQDSEFVQWTYQWLEACLPLMKPKYNAFVFCSPNNAADIEMDVLRAMGLEVKSRIIWSHRNMSMGRDVEDRFINTYDVILHFGNRALNWPPDWNDRRFDVQTFAAPQTNFGDMKLHQTQKPIELIKLLCEIGSYKGDNILDPFSGSGTTGAACQELDRNCTMIDRDFAALSAARVGGIISGK